MFFLPLHIILDALWKYCFAWAISPCNQREIEFQFVAVLKKNQMVVTLQKPGRFANDIEVAKAL